MSLDTPILYSVGEKNRLLEINSLGINRYIPLTEYFLTMRKFLGGESLYTYVQVQNILSRYISLICIEFIISLA